MNIKIIKTLLITLSSLYIIIELVIEGFIKKIVHTANYPIEHIPFIISIILLIVGVFIKIEQKKRTKNCKIKYIIFIITGILLFIGIILYNLYLTINISNIITIDEFISNLIFLSYFVWPLYIIGALLIILNLKNII